MTSISETLAAALENFRAGHLNQAEELCRDVLQSQPQHDSAWRLLGAISSRLGNYEIAVVSLKRSLSINSLNAECHNYLGEAYRLMGRLEEAVHSFKTALEIDTNSVEAWNNLGIALAELCRPKAAIAGFRRAIAIRPESAEAHGNLGLALLYQGKLSEAIDAFRQALSLKPDYANAWHNLAVALKDQGCLDEANDAFEQALEIDPDNPAARSAYVMTLHYVPQISAERLLRESLDWSERHAEKVVATPVRNHENDPAKRLRIGYVSGDFRSHPVGYLLQPVLSRHDRSGVEIFCYANHVIYDEQSERLHRAADHWRTIVGFSDEKLAQQIRDDSVDILVDLSGHTDRNRLSVFAHKPAPVQVTWLGYFSSTGLNTIDYLIADGTLIPPDEEKYYVEQVIRLPDCWFCFSPPEDVVELNAAPALSQGAVTFGCFNNITKVSPDVIALWAEILHAVPKSRLCLKTMALGDAGVRSRYESFFVEQGISAERLQFEGRSSRTKMHEALRAIDIGLDPFPFNGATTTLETLWMGVPVISLRGNDRFVSHMGESILSTAGLSELIADSNQDYVSKAVALASDFHRLDELRRRIRPQLLASPLCDVQKFTHNLEEAYRAMWTRHCQCPPRAEGRQPPGTSTRVLPPGYFHPGTSTRVLPPGG